MESILKRIKDNKIEIVRFEQTDMFGISRSKLIPARHFKSKAENGLNFYMGHLGADSMSNFIPGTGYNEEKGYADAIMFPDLDTFQVIPWWENTAKILIEPTYEGSPVPAHPRVVARKQLEELHEMGYSLLSAHEHEFYVVDGHTRNPVVNDYNIRSTIRMYECAPFIHQLVRDLPKVGIDIESIENEFGPGQHEITYKPSFGIKAADNAFTYKCSIKEIAKQHNLVATFMSKPYDNASGSSCHYNHSLWDVDGKKSLMLDSRSDKLSEVAKYWIAGNLYHAAALSLLMGPTINCRKRYKPFSFAPTNATWGYDNRTCAVRVKINGECTYIENRMGGAGSNPYLVLAATVAAGIDGIKNKLPLPDNVTGSAYVPEDVPDKTSEIPTTMESAVEAFVQDEVMRRAFGEEFTKCFVAIKESERKRANEANCSGFIWDRKNYFEYL
ncbi:lengsin-like [Anneissia japonica]|uniref:lengsin-like n=1 Tax=Anneissia japonica TaxID=1529436 RepID=UPI001425760A|nr:lengsin-like [Anneissia japonica]XP_033107206.1 lengsin-like [Anneissia japonica]